MILPSGVSLLDRILNGGLFTGSFTHVYGEAAAGKTTLALQYVDAAYRLDYGTICINTETASPVERLEQVTGHPFNELENLVKIFVPKGFNEQGALIDDLDLYIREDTKLIVIDTLTKFYRLELEDKATNYSNHRELNRQAGILKGVARKHDVVVLVLNQVRARMEEMGDFEPVAKNILDYWSDSIVKMRVGKEQGSRVIKRIRPEGEPSDGRLYLTDKGLSMEKPDKKSEIE
ncbi:MAG: ATPase domain-containing protein [Candidatus Thorarchaeota archaeon]